VKVYRDLKMYARFGRGLPGYLRQRLTLEEAESIVRQRLAERESNFLRVVERGIFDHPSSPYLRLMKLSGCRLGDIREMVAGQGLEQTLDALRQEGVYVTYEEFKGRIPVVRQGREIPIESHEFDNPFASYHYYSSTSGTSGAGTRVGIDLDYLASRAPQNLLFEHVHDFYGAPQVYYFGALPDHGLNSLLTRSRFGSIPQRWFTPVRDGESRAPMEHRIANAVLPRLARLAGIPAPLPEPLPLSETHVIARWMVETLAAEGRCVVRTSTSRAVRICLAAKERSWRLDGAIITIGGEAPTPAKTKIIRDTGAKPLTGYHMTEIGPIGFACANPTDENDVHFLKDHLAVIQTPRQVPGFDVEVQAFLFTTLLPTAPKLLLNYEGDDYGLLEKRQCGCLWESYGLTEHMRGIRSYRKLTGEGMTFVGSDMERILDEVLPGRFGGSPLDYQMAEEEDEQGLTRLTVIVDPRVAIDDEQAVIDTVLEAVGRLQGFHGMAAGIWRQAETIRVRRESPRVSGAGKLIPLQLPEGHARSEKTT